MLSFAIATGVAACALLVTVAAIRGVGLASLWAGVLAALAGVVAAGAALWPLLFRPSIVPPEFQVPDWVVDRPAELTSVVAAVLKRRSGMETTGLYGAGGFGKTTLARMVCADRRVRRRFGGRVYLVTAGRDLRGAAAVRLYRGANSRRRHVSDVGHHLPGSFLVLLAERPSG